MRLLAIDDLDLQTLNMHALPLVTSDSISMEFARRRREGELGSMFVAGAPEPSRWVVQFQPDDHAARDAILAAVTGDMRGERRLLARRDDAAQTRVAANAAVAYVEYRNELDFTVAFEGSDSVWRAEAETVTAKTFALAADAAMAVEVAGSAAAYPVLRITPTVQRASPSVYAGWRWRRRYRIQNNGDVPWYRHPVRIALGDTTGLTPTKAQADGDDLRVWLHGIEQPRTLVTWDTAASYVWVLVPNLPEGEYLDFDVVYGNPNAANPPILAYPDIPAFDLAASANDSLVWDNDAGTGLYYISSADAPATLDYGTPGSWRPVVSLQDEQNPDYSYFSPTQFFLSEGPGDPVQAGAFFWRTAADAEPYDQYMRQINGYDGLAFSWPFPVESLTFAGSADNSPFTGSEANGVALVLLSRESSETDWFVEYGYTASFLSAVHLLFRPARHIAVALWPYQLGRTTVNPDAMGSPQDYGTGGVAGGAITAAIDDSDLSITLVESETEIYELAGEARAGGGANRQAPYRAVLLGNARQETGAGTPRLAVKLGNTLAVDCEDHTHIEYAASGAVVERASAHAVSGVEGFDAAGEAREAGAAEWLPLAPGKTAVPNGDFAAGVQGWEADGADAGLTVARGWDSATAVGEALGAASIQITASSGAALATARTLGATRFGVNARATVEVAATVRGSAANLSPLLAVRFYDAADSPIATETGAANYGVTGTPYRTAFSAPVPPNATGFRIGLWAIDQTGGTTGTVLFDDVRCNAAEVIFRDEAIGTVAVGVGVKAAYLT